MTVDMWAEAWFFALSIVFGMGVGALFSLGRIWLCALGVAVSCARPIPIPPRSLPLLGGLPRVDLRMRGKRCKSLLCALTDFVLWVLSGLAYTVFLYAFHNGIFRFYSLLGVMLGFWVYYSSIGRLIERGLLLVLGLLRAVLAYLFLPLWCLFRLVRLHLRRIRHTLPPYSVLDGGTPPRPVALGLLPYLCGRLYLWQDVRRERKARHRRIRILLDEIQSKTDSPF